MKQLLNTMEERGISQARLLIIDMNGHPKFMIIPRDHLKEAATGIGIDGSSIPGYTTVDESDLIAKPDMKSAVFLENEVALFCDVEYDDGRTFEGDPRGILKKVLEKENGTFLAKPELEFFLLRGTAPLDDKGYMDEAEGLAIVERAVESVAIPVEKIHHENGPGQYEVEPLTAPALDACDRTILLKEMLKKKAHETQVTATFMPKPFAGEAGSGMHFHILLEKNGENLFEPFSKMGLYFVGGLLSHAKGITAVCSPTINSYKRLIPHFEAPVHICWGRGNRSVLVRIPLGGKTRIEYRAPDPSCNPYLALALMVGAGLDGVQRKTKPPEEVTENVFGKQDPHTLPATLMEALAEMEKDSLVKKILGDHVVTEFFRLKKEEIQKYTAHVSGWELDHYLEG